MKKTVIIKTFIAVILSSQFVMAGTKNLSAPELVYKSLVKTFPEFNENIGGFSYEIDLKELICSSSNTIGNDGAVRVQTECLATDLYGNQLVRPAEELFLNLLNAGVPTDKQSEAGTTYIVLNNLSCGVLEPRSSDPSNPVDAEYFCSVEK